MAKTKISEYSATAGSNTDIDSISIAEGMAPSNVNNAFRELMAHLKDMDAGTNALTSPEVGTLKVSDGAAYGLLDYVNGGSGEDFLDIKSYEDGSGAGRTRIFSGTNEAARFFSSGTTGAGSTTFNYPYSTTVGTGTYQLVVASANKSHLFLRSGVSGGQADGVQYGELNASSGQVELTGWNSADVHIKIGTSKIVDIDATGMSVTGDVTSSGSFIIGSASINENDLESIDGITAGTVVASKAVVVDANKDISSFRNVTISGKITSDSNADVTIEPNGSGDFVVETDSSHFRNTDAGQFGPKLFLDHATSSPAASDYNAQVYFKTTDLGSNIIYPLRIDVLSPDVTDSAATGKALFNIKEDGASDPIVYLELDGDSEEIILWKNTSISGDVTATGSFIIGSASMSEADLEQLDGITAGTVLASKALVVDSNKKLNELLVDNITIDGNTLSSTDTNGHIYITPNGSGNVYVNTDTVQIKAANGEDALLVLSADDSDDPGDDWLIQHESTNNTLLIANDISGSDIAHVTLTPNATVANSTAAFAGNLTSSRKLTVTAADGVADADYVGQFQNQESDDGRSFGVTIAAGSNGSDIALNVVDHDASNILLRVAGNGATTIGGRVIMGTATDSNAHANADDLIIGNVPASGENRGITIVSGDNANGAVHFSDGTASGSANIQGQFIYDHSTSKYLFYVSAEERLSLDYNLDIKNGNLLVADGHGVYFGATSGGSSTAELLNDYEEGTFTATLTSASAPTSPPTVTGLYTKIGRSVTVSMFFVAVDTSGGSGAMSITGLPYAAGSAIGNRGSGAVQFYGITFAGEYAVAEAAGTAINFRGIASNAAWTDLTITAGTGKYLQTTITYTT